MCWRQITLIFFLLIVLVLVTLYQPQEMPKHGISLSNTESYSQADKNTINIINIINKKNESITSFACQDIDILLKNRIIFNAHGELFYNKDRDLRLKISSLFGKEMDIGSNSTMFWFWSKRMRPSELNYSSYANMGNTGLKTPFNPLWLKGILGFDRIETKDIKISEHNGLIEIGRKERNILGDEIDRITVIDKTRQLILAHFLYEDDKLVASSEIIEMRNGYPYKILISWNEEGIAMLWTFNSPEINGTISESQFLMPNITPKIDIGVISQKL